MSKNFEVQIIRNEPAAVKNTIDPHEPVSADEIREIYYNKAEFFVNRLRHSVTKKYDHISSQNVYQREIADQTGMMKQLLFLQKCRAAIEQAVESGRGEAEGEKTKVTFIRTDDGLIQSSVEEKV